LTVHLRNCARALLVTPDRRILLFHMRIPDLGEVFEIWLTPGGGVSPDEAIEEGLRREVREETGLAGFDIGPQVWRREHEFDLDGRRILQREAYFLVSVAEFEPDIAANPEDHEQAATVGWRWWTPEEIAASEDLFAPHRLGELLIDLLEAGPPREPIDSGV